MLFSCLWKISACKALVLNFYGIVNRVVMSLKDSRPIVYGRESIDRAMLTGPACHRTYYCDTELTIDNFLAPL